MDANIERYMQRLGLEDAPRECSLALLAQISSQHLRSIAFENIDVVLRQPISLAPAAMNQKLLLNQRGGYCFEQNGLLLLHLRALGFVSYPVLCKVFETCSYVLSPHSLGALE